MNYIGIDIGSTASKVCILTENADPIWKVIPTGWNSKITAGSIKEDLENVIGDLSNSKIVATGYGRISVEYADKNITEISCHGRGGSAMIGEDCSVIDIGGQDIKFIEVKDGKAVDFLMNDKCAAGTGKFIEVMANLLGLTIDELFELAEQGTPISISSLCTVFAESEVINYMGEGCKKEDLASGVVDSVAAKVATLVQRKPLSPTLVLTGGLSGNEYFASGGNYFKGDIIVVPFGPENKDRIGIVSSVDNVPFDELPVPEYEMKVPGGVLNRDIVRQNENHMP